MGSIGGLLGTAGGVAGTGISGPQGADLAQQGRAYDQTQAGIKQQQDFSNALNPASLQAIQSQQALLGQLQDQSNGVGPNPALAQLNQTTGQNIASQNALMAGQRGSSANPALIARQAAQQGAATQQNAVGQAATLNAQQQLAARQQLAAQQAQLVGQGQTGLNALNQFSQGQQANLLGIQNGTNSANAALAGQGMKGQQGLIGGVLNGAGSILGSLAEGGKVKPQYAPGGNVSGPQSMLGQSFQMGGDDDSDKALQQGTSNFVAGVGKLIARPSSPAPQSVVGGPGDAMTNAPNSQPGVNDEVMKAAKGGIVPAMVSPGEQYLPPKDVEKVKQGSNPMSVGEKIPGEPKVKGAKNSYANDTVPKNLEEGGIVIPRSITQGKNPHWEAMKFVHAHMAKGGKIPKKPKGNE